MNDLDTIVELVAESKYPWPTVLACRVLEDMSARLVVGDPGPLTGWEHIWSMHTDEAEARAELIEARKHAQENSR